MASSYRTGSSSAPSANGASRTPASRRSCPATVRSLTSSGSSTSSADAPGSPDVSDEGADRNLAVPVDAGAVEPPENLLEIPAELDQLGETRQYARRIHVAYAAAARHGGAERERVAVALVLCHRRIEAPGGDAPVMKAVAAPLDHLAVHRRRIVVGLDQLHVHVPRKAHREPHIRPRGLPAIHRVDAGEMIEHEPGADTQPGDPFLDRRVEIGHDVGHLNDAVVRLTKTHLAHNASPGAPRRSPARHST